MASLATVKSTTPASNSTRQLYRSFLRLHRSWPHEPSRPGRNLRDHLQKRIHQFFRQEQTLTASHAKRMHAALVRIKNDDALREFPRAALFRPVYSQAYPLLSTSMQDGRVKIKAIQLVIPTLVGWIKFYNEKWISSLLQKKK